MKAGPPVVGNSTLQRIEINPVARSIGITRNCSVPRPDRSIAWEMQPWLAAEVYAVNREGASAMPERRIPAPSAAVRAVKMASRLAIEVPVTKSPLARLGKSEELAHPLDDLPLHFNRDDGRGRRGWR